MQTLDWSPTFSLETFPCSSRCWAFGNSGSKVPVFELREYFLVKPPWKKTHSLFERLVKVKSKSKNKIIFTSFLSLLPENLQKKNNTLVNVQILVALSQKWKLSYPKYRLPKMPFTSDLSKVNGKKLLKSIFYYLIMNLIQKVTVIDFKFQI